MRKGAICGGLTEAVRGLEEFLAKYGGVNGSRQSLTGTPAREYNSLAVSCGLAVW